MILIAEKINASVPRSERAILERDEEYISKLAVDQAKAGADYIDVNAGTLVSDEIPALVWLTRIVQEACGLPLCLDSANPEALEAAIKVHEGKAILSSVTAETDRLQRVARLALEYDCSVIALCMGEQGIPETSQERVQAAESIMDRLAKLGIEKDRVLFDTLVQPIGLGSQMASTALETMRILKERLGMQTVCGLSNVSFGLPKRRLLNRVYVCMSADFLDAAICDVLDQELVASVIASRALSGRDENCLGYIDAYRTGRLGA